MRIVVLADRSLFMAGITSRLREHLDRLEVKVVDYRQPDAMAHVIAAQPSVLILSGALPAGEPVWSLDGLLQAMPALQIVRLDPQCAQIQVIRSEQRLVTAVDDLIKVITSGAEWSSPAPAESAGAEAPVAGAAGAVSAPARQRLSLEPALGRTGS